MEDIFDNDAEGSLSMGFVIDPVSLKPKLVFVVDTGETDGPVNVVVGGKAEGLAMAETIETMSAQCVVLEDGLEMADPQLYDEAVAIAMEFGKRVNAPYN